MYENVNFYATDHPMNLAEDTYARLEEAEYYARDERENPEAFLPYADGENGPHWSDIPFEEPPLFRFGQIIRPRSRFMDQLGTIWSCHEKNRHSVTFYKCWQDGSEIETVPSMAVPYKGMTDAQVMEANGLQPLMIPDNMLICHCQFRETERADACYDCDDLGLIHCKSHINSIGRPDWIHVINGPQTSVETLQAALIETITCDLWFRDHYSPDGSSLNTDWHRDYALIEWERMITPEEERLLRYNQYMQWESNNQAMCI